MNVRNVVLNNSKAIDITKLIGSRYTGLVTSFGLLGLRPHDPDIVVWAGSIPIFGPRKKNIAIGGAGWTEYGAQMACLGECIERYQSYAFSQDQIVKSSFSSWSIDAQAVEPRRWVLFHSEQYSQPHFHFQPFTDSTVCRWVRFRDFASGLPIWVPEDMAYLFSYSPLGHQIAPSISTGLSCGCFGDPVLLRGVQEIIERDALVGMWWEKYELEEWDSDYIFKNLDDISIKRIIRPNLRYRFYRINSPFSSNVTVVTLEGLDREGFCFSVGSACRETRNDSWLKSILEAIQGRHYVRYLKKTIVIFEREQQLIPTDFSEHAVFYSLYPEKLALTVFNTAKKTPDYSDSIFTESLSLLADRLGSDKQILFRNITPIGFAEQFPDWYVLKVVIPGLQPLHGNHYFPHLGGALWAPHGFSDWFNTLPHPFA